MIKTEIIPIGLLVFFALVIGVLIVVFWLLRNYVLPLIKKRSSARNASAWILRIEILSWFLFSLFAFYRLMIVSPVITVVFAAVLIVLGWTFWKDFFAGLLFRIERLVEVGDFIRIDEQGETMQEDIVQKVSYRNITVRRANGEIVLIPFNKLNELSMTKSHPEGKLFRQRFIIEMANMDELKAKETLIQLLYENPWVVPAQKPIIENLGNGTYQITAFASDKDASERLVGFIKRKVESET